MSESVQSIVRALRIIETISAHNNSISISELSREVSLHKSTVHRILGTLIQEGYVHQNAQNNKYELALKLFELGATIVKESDLKSIARPYLENIRDLSGEVVHLVVPDNTDIIYIDKVESQQTLRMHSFVGKRSPMYCTAVGKAILAERSNQDIKSYWQSITPVKLTDTTIIDYNRFMDEILEIRMERIAFDNEEQELDIKCIAVSLQDFNGVTVGAVSVSGPLTRMTDEKLNILKPELLKVKHYIAQQLGRI